jgi:hypothetical protein
MKKKIVVIVSLIITVIGTSAFIVKQSTGMVGKTGAPGEGDCSSCHSGGSGVTTVSITGSPAFTSNQYNPGQTYTVSVEVSSTTLTKFGFDCAILDGTSSGATNAGTMTAISGSSQVQTSGTRKNATHTTPGSGSPSSKIFTFKWVAPASGTAAIYAAGLAVNSDGNTTGDKVNTNSLILTSSGVTGIQSLDIKPLALSIFPNPVMSHFNLTYNLSQEGVIKATLYNLEGKELNTLFTENQQAGEHHKTLMMDANLSSGIYLVKLSLNNTIIGEERIIKN